MSSTWKFLLVFVVLIGLGVLGYQFFDSQFRFDNIRFEGNQNNLQINPVKFQKLQDILNQQFTYLDRGKQSYVFASQDNRYVIKFFDRRCLKSGSFFSPLDQAQCNKKMSRLIEGYRVADAQDSDHAGIIFIQLAPNSNLDKHLDVRDRFGITHNIDLSQVAFVIQLKAIPTRDVISKLLIKGNVKGAIQHLEQILDMYVDEYRRGLYDTDHNFMYNTGFIGERPLRIDVGRLRIDESMKHPEVYTDDLNKIIQDRLGDWLERHFPLYKKEILDSLNAKFLAQPRS